MFRILKTSTLKVGRVSRLHLPSISTLSHLTIEEFQTAKELDFFTKAATKLFTGKVSKEYIEEMKGMVRGMQKAGKEITYEQMLFMNGSIDIL